MINDFVLKMFDETWGDIQKDKRKLHKTPEKTKDYIPDVDNSKEFIKAHPAPHTTDGSDRDIKKVDANLEKMQGGFRGE